MNNAERRALEALMRGVAVLLRIASWQLQGKFDGPSGIAQKRKWAEVMKREASDLFREWRRLRRW